MGNIPYIKIDQQEEITQLYLNNKPIHEDKVDLMNKLKDGHLILIEIYKRNKMVWKGYKVKDKAFKEMFKDMMERKYYV